MQTVIITGGSRGIGYYAARTLVNAGCKVYEISRHGESKDGICHMDADVLCEQQIISCVNRVVQAEGRIDLLICCAGYGISGAAEMTDPQDAHRQLDVNLYGMDAVVRAVVPQMRKQETGRIVLISSVAGMLPIPFQLWYSVSKAAINAYTLALQNELKPFGISVCAVLPGDISTGFTAARKKSQKGDDVYQGRIKRSVAVMEHDELHGMSAQKAGGKIADYALRRRSRPLITMGFSYKCFVILAKLLPRRLSNWIVYMIYAK